MSTDGMDLQQRQTYVPHTMANIHNTIFSYNVPTKFIKNVWHYSLFTLTCFSMTLPFSGSTYQT